MYAVRKNKEHSKAQAAYNMFRGDAEDGDATRITNQMENIIDIRYRYICSILYTFYIVFLHRITQDKYFYIVWTQLLIVGPAGLKIS